MEKQKLLQVEGCPFPLPSTAKGLRRRNLQVIRDLGLTVRSRRRDYGGGGFQRFREEPFWPTESWVCCPTMGLCPERSSSKGEILTEKR